MGIFKLRSKESATPPDMNAQRYLSSAPPGPRADNLASACILNARALPITASSERGRSLSLADLAPVEALAQQVMRQDRALAAAVARKVVSNVGPFRAGSGVSDFGEWCEAVIGANGMTSKGPRPINLLAGASDVDGTVMALADAFWLTFRAVNLGKNNASTGEWSFYSSLYTDPKCEALSYRESPHGER